MISREEILKLATLSRLKISEEEIGRMQADLSSILGYVDKLKEAKAAEEGLLISGNKNVLREDTGAHEGGIFTDTLVKAAPRHAETKDGLFVKVKKILGGSQ